MHSSANAEPHAFSRPQTLYLWLAMIFMSSLLVADIVGVKLFRIPLPFPILGFEAIEHTCGMLTFPITFLLTDLVNDFYGPRAARRLTYLGFAAALYVFLIINIAQAMPYLDAPWNVSPEEFNAIFGSAKIMYIASLCAYLVGQLSDIWIFGVFKRLTGERLIWLRATGSTVISQFIDSFIVSYLAFSLGRELFPDPANPAAPVSAIPAIAVTGYALKCALALAITPLIYLGRRLMRRYVLGHV
ncbi:MAG: queuosine precursor transporter [Gammaproteobacteria bacterium]